MLPRFLLAAACTASLMAAPVRAELVLDQKLLGGGTRTADPIPAAPVLAEDCFKGIETAAPDAGLAPFPAAKGFAPLDRSGKPLPANRWANAPWRSVTQSDPALRAAALPVAQVGMCHVTPDGLPREVSMGQTSSTFQSGYVSQCTGIVLPGSRLLLPDFCLLHPMFEEAGFTTARVMVQLGAADANSETLMFEADPSQAVVNADVHMAVLPLAGDPLGNHAMAVAPDLPDYHPLVMLHFPLSQRMQVSSGNCLVLPAEADDTPFMRQHSCETAPGSGGGLLLDARSLAPWGIHFSRTRDGKRQAMTLRAIDAALDLGLAAE